MSMIRLYIVTDNADRAVRYVLGVPRSDMPHWAAIADNSEAIHRIPAGSRCIGTWFEDGPLTDNLRGQWEARRFFQRDTVGLSAKFLENLSEWQKRREAAGI